MFGEAGRIEPADQMLQPCQMIGIQCPLATDGEADAMDGDGKLFAEVAQLRNRAATVAHVIFGMDFQPFHRACIGEDIGKMLRLVANTCGSRQERGGVQHGRSSDPVTERAGEYPRPLS